MPFEKGHKLAKGRPAGVPNKMTTSAKECIALVAERLGGPDALEEWVRANPNHLDTFWERIYPRLLPIQLAGDSKNPLEIKFVNGETQF